MREDFAMMGIQVALARLFYDFDLEPQVPAKHLLCQIAASLMATFCESS